MHFSAIMTAFLIVPLRDKTNAAKWLNVCTFVVLLLSILLYLDEQ